MKFHHSKEITKRGLAGPMLFIRMYVILTALSFGVGVALLSGGDQRFSAPSLKGPSDLVSPLPWDPWVTWGVSYIVMAVLLASFFGERRGIYVLWVNAALLFFWAFSLGVSAFHNPVVPFTGIVAYVVFGLIHLMVGDYLSSHGWR